MYMLNGHSAHIPYTFNGIYRWKCTQHKHSEYFAKLIYCPPAKWIEISLWPKLRVNRYTGLAVPVCVHIDTGNGAAHDHRWHSMLNLCRDHEMLFKGDDVMGTEEKRFSIQEFVLIRFDSVSVRMRIHVECW